MTDGTAPKHPGRTLLDEVMTPLGVSRNRLARDIDVPVGRISEIVSGKRAITPDTALRLSKYFGTTPELWLRLQYQYDLYLARTETWPAIEPRVRVLAPAGDVAHGADSTALAGGVRDESRRPSAPAAPPSSGPPTLWPVPSPERDSSE